MAALTADRSTPQRDGNDFSFPVAASTKLYAGSLVAINSGNYLTKGAVATTLKAVGVCQNLVDNSAGANGAVNANVRRGVFRFLNSSAGDLIVLSDIGASCYIVDDQTVAKTNGGATRSIAGTVRDVDADGVWVQF